MIIEFHEIAASKLISYNNFVKEVNNHDLKELNGYKVRNIMSLAFKPKISNLIINYIFDTNSTILSDETKDYLKRNLSSDEKDDLKSLLTDYLNYQIKSSWYNRVCDILADSNINTLVVSSSIMESDEGLNELKVLFPQKIFTDWRSVNDSKSALFLDYNDSWKKRNIFNYPQNDSKCIFLKHFFQRPYKRRIYNDEYQIFESINTTLRKKLFGDEIIAGLKVNLQTLKPSVSSNEWDLLHESDDKNYNNPQEGIIIHYSSKRCNKYRINTSFLLFKEEKFSIENAKNLVINPKKYENHFHFSHLDSLIDDIDLHELNKAIEKDNSINQIIQPLWKRFNLNENDGKIWKLLLQRKVQENGLSNVYSAIESISAIKNFVSINTFKNTYCDPSSTTIIPREKKVFKAICKYLQLPLEYRAAIHRERILIGGHSKELNMKLKQIIEAIIRFGVLDNYKNDDKLLEVLSEVSDKIEEKIDMDYFGFNRDSLIYASLALCYEIIDKVQSMPIIKKIEQHIP